MSEELKCPCCGGEHDVLIDLFDKHGKYPKGYSCCGAEFRELEHWNQYAAAMELAKAVVKVNKIYHMPLIRIEGKLNDAAKAEDAAKERVLEVFK